MNTIHKNIRKTFDFPNNIFKLQENSYKSSKYLTAS